MTHKERARNYIEAMPEAVSGSGGHPATFKVACVLWNGFRLEHDDVEPVEVKSGVPHFDLGRAIRALLQAGETAKDRQARLQSDILEEKLRRMKGESLDRAACVAVWGDKMKRLADAIKGTDRLRHKEKVKLCDQLRHEMERMPVDLQECTFSDFDLPDGESIEEQDTKTA